MKKSLKRKIAKNVRRRIDIKLVLSADGHEIGEMFLTDSNAVVNANKVLHASNLSLQTYSGRQVRLEEIASKDKLGLGDRVIWIDEYSHLTIIKMKEKNYLNEFAFRCLTENPFNYFEFRGRGAPLISHFSANYDRMNLSYGSASKSKRVVKKERKFLKYILFITDLGKGKSNYTIVL